MQWNDLVSPAAVTTLVASVAVVATCWKQLLAWYSAARGLVFVSVEAIDWETEVALVAFLMRECRHRGISSSSPVRTYASLTEYVRREGREMRVPVEMIGGGTKIYWAKGTSGKWWPLWVTRSSRAGAGTQDHDNKTRLEFLRGTFAQDEIITRVFAVVNAVLDEDIERLWSVTYLSGTAGKAYDHKLRRGDFDEPLADHVGLSPWRAARPVGYSREELGRPGCDGSALDRVAMGAPHLAAVEAVKHWRANSQWFADHGVPWRMGLLPYGPPGTGKTTFVKALARDLRMRVFVLDLRTFHNDEFTTAWQRLGAHAPCVALIEDIDAVFVGREPVNDSVQLSFDRLLNCIDGADETSGILTVITTNKPETLDAALWSPDSSRPGRIDRALPFGPLDAHGKKLIAERLLAGYPAMMARVLDAAHAQTLTGAVFERWCLDELAAYQRECCREYGEQTIKMVTAAPCSQSRDGAKTTVAR